MSCTFSSNALGPMPTDVTVSPNGCQSLRVTWTHRAPTSPLTLNHYRVRYQRQSGSVLAVTTTSQGSYTLTSLAPATTYTVRVDAQTQLGYGFHCCVPTATTHNGEASSVACRVTRWLRHLAVYYYFTISVSGKNIHSSVLSVGVTAVIGITHIILHPLAHAVPCSFSETEVVPLSLLQWVPHRGSH